MAYTVGGAWYSAKNSCQLEECLTNVSETVQLQCTLTLLRMGPLSRPATSGAARCYLHDKLNVAAELQKIDMH